MAKGDRTRSRIVEQALKDASLLGLEGLSVGQLATEVGMSKSGLFAHFGSKEELQQQVLAAGAERFAAIVVAPALQAPRGLPRVQLLFEGWLQWERDVSVPGGCVFTHAAVELDDKPGPVRDALAALQWKLRSTIARAASIAIEAGHFRPDLDPQQFAFRMFGIVLAYYHTKRLLADPAAEPQARAAFGSLLDWAAGHLPR